MIDPIIDMRFQSYLRLYIHDILSADRRHHEMASEQPPDNSNNKSRNMIRINDLYFYKVSFTGLIVNIYEAAKYYRLKIDDSTGCIDVTLWKSSVVQDEQLRLSGGTVRPSADALAHCGELYRALALIQARTKDPACTHRVLYKPNQGDLVFVRGNVNLFRQRIEVSAVSCTRVRSASDELTHMMLPAIVHDRVYSVRAPTAVEYDAVVRDKNEQEAASLDADVKENSNPRVSESNCGNISSNNSIKNMPLFLNLVNKSLVQLTSNLLDKSLSTTQRGVDACAQPADAYAVFSHLRNNCPAEFRFVTQKQVLDALKELEMRCRIYSCDDDFHYLPLI